MFNPTGDKMSRRGDEGGSWDQGCVGVSGPSACKGVFRWSGRGGFSSSWIVGGRGRGEYGVKYPPLREGRCPWSL